ncbi:MAG: efflux RND transporter periplasmic adaptor subunit [Pseudomonadota bacterium]
MTESSSPASAASLAALRQAAPVRRRRRRWVWALAAALLAAGAAWFGLKRPAQVQASTVGSAFPSAQHAQLSASGYVVAQRRAAVASKATGRLVELRVREGSEVRQGELIGRIDAADVQAALLAAQAGIRQAAGALAQAEAQRLLAQVERGNAEAEWQRAQALKAQGFLSPQAVDAAQRRADGARAGVVAAEAGIQAAQGAQAAAQAQLALQRVNLANTEIRAPFDGVVLVKNANVGDMITPFSSAGGTQGAVVTMADMGTLEVEADVSESNVAKIRIDMPVEITLDALPDARLPGSVVRIVPTVDRAKATVMTKIRFEKLDPRVLPEMSAKVTFLSQRAAEADRRAVTAVHPKTVIERDGARVVLRIGAGDVLEAVPVKTGRTLGDRLAVEGALERGQRLVLAPAPDLRPGSRVAVRP